MKISVITPVYNGASTIESCIKSVKKQSYKDFEYIIVDGGSTDNTLEIIKHSGFENLKWVSEKDNGLYDAFNKGIKMATGDVICFLCADDMYTHEKVLQNIATAFKNNPDTEMIYTDIIYVDKDNLSKIDRYWKSSSFVPGLFKKGWLPPNTALFIQRKVFLEHGMFDTRYRLASDYEMQYRLFEKLRLRSLYITGVSVTMRSGGMSNSNLRGMYKSLRECYLALKQHNVKFPIIYIINTIFYRFRQVFIPAEIKKSYKSKTGII